MTEKNLYITELNRSLQQQTPKDILKFAFSKFNSQAMSISFSGAEDVVLIDMAVKLEPNLQVFTLDTGRLHPETYRFIDSVKKHYNISIDVIFPEHTPVETMIKEKGYFSFYQDGHQECCSIRKIAPLKRRLSTLDAWVTGQRKDQSPSTRSSVNIIEIDTAFSNVSGEPLIKFNPLANWSSEEVWNYIKMFEVPYNELHNRGFISIGCEPCTRPVLPGQHEREGRWWWEESTQKECGLHSGNMSK